MASDDEMKKIAIKAIEDDNFRAVFEKDPEEAAKSMGITLTPEQISALKKSAADLSTSRESKGFISGIVSTT